MNEIRTFRLGLVGLLVAMAVGSLTLQITR
jgi:hypothetical protein